MSEFREEIRKIHAICPLVYSSVIHKVLENLAKKDKFAGAAAA